MAQLITPALIVIGLLAISIAIFMASRDRQERVADIVTSQQQVTATSTARAIAEPSQTGLLHPRNEMIVTEEVQPLLRMETLSLLLSGKEPLADWWQGQLQELTSKVDDLRQQSRAVERHIAILTTMASCLAELDDLHNTRMLSIQEKASPQNFSDQPVRLSLTTEKRPYRPKYTSSAPIN